MKVSIEGKFKLGLTEVPDKLAKELEEKLKKITGKHGFGDLKVKVEEDD